MGMMFLSKCGRGAVYSGRVCKSPSRSYNQSTHFDILLIVCLIIFWHGLGKSWGGEVTAQREVDYLLFSLSIFSWSSHSKKSHEVQLCRLGNHVKHLPLVNIL